MNFLALAFFILLSSIFWFFLALNKNYIEVISFPVKYENFPPKRINVGELPKKLNITVETSGMKIIKYKIWSQVDPLNINIAKISLFQVSRYDTSKYYVLTNVERRQISEQLASEIRIMDINPDTIMFYFDYLKLKKIPIIADIEISCQKQYMLVGKPFLEPDSILLSGPSSVLDTLRAIYTERIILDDVYEPINKNISLEKIPGTNADTRKILLIADVDKYTETKLEIPIISKNVPDTLELKTFPNTVTVSYLIPFKIFESITSDDFQMTVDYNNISTSSDKLKVNLERIPENVNVLGWGPKSVEFIIEI